MAGRSTFPKVELLLFELLLQLGDNELGRSSGGFMLMLLLMLLMLVLVLLLMTGGFAVLSVC